MRLCAVLLLSVLTVSSEAKRCLLHLGKCVPHCPARMHPYHTRCDTSTVSQLTCSAPRPEVVGFTCGWSRCDCNGGLVLDEAEGLCVHLKDCSPQQRRGGRRGARGGGAPSGFKIPRNLNLHADGALRSVELMHHDPVIDYTGHCPLLKFRYGKCYGDNTRQILKEIRSSGLFNTPLEYRAHEPLPACPPAPHAAPRARPPARVTGYTGYVPGMYSSYGKSYGRAADDCLSSFAARQSRRADVSRSYARSRSAPRVETVRSRDEVRRDLHRFREINKYKENTISPEFPPIAGYTGHIPRIKGTEASLSQRYHCAAQRGLELIHQELQKRRELQTADTKIRSILKDHDRKYSYLNWG